MPFTFLRRTVPALCGPPALGPGSGVASSRSFAGRGVSLQAAWAFLAALIGAGLLCGIESHPAWSQPTLESVASTVSPPPGLLPGPFAPSSGKPSTASLIEGRVSYMWGANEVRFRDGDNPFMKPAWKRITLNSLTFEAGGETFVMDDLAIRGGGWINLPSDTGNDFYFLDERRHWETDRLCFGADLSAVYHFNLGGMPYGAGIIAGVRYNQYRYDAIQLPNPANFMDDRLQVLVPHLGVYYANSDLIGSVFRLDILASPITLALLDSDGRLNDSSYRVDGHSLTGIWFESYFQWALPINETFMVGLNARYRWLELSGGATMKIGARSSRYSLDSTHHIICTGGVISVTF